MENTYTVRIFSAADTAIWNKFIRSAKNATFLFDRNFMDYHSDRFCDHSLVVLDASGNWAAVLPAHLTGNVLCSHAGLTYGGLVFAHGTRLAQVVKIFHAILSFLAAQNISTLSLKMLPSIYPDTPSDELLYAVFLSDAKLTRRDTLSVLDLSSPVEISKDRRKCVRRGQNAGLEIREDGNLELFWNAILIPNMQRKHGVSPVHSLDEISLLHRRFPDNIRHFNVYNGDEIVAGTTVFVTPNVAHPQYISANDAKNALGSLDYLYSELITKVFREKRYFDFGVSNESQGRKLNTNLAFWKESFGTGVVVQDFYEVQTGNHHLLESVLI